MSKVKLITEISKSAYDTIMAKSVLTPNEAAKAIDAILNSTPLTESNDTVSREEVCSIANGLKDYCVSMYNPNDASEAEIINYIYKYVDALYDLPSVTPKREQSEWILVSEGLPKVDGSYRVMQKNGSIGTYVFHKDGNSEEYWKRCAVAWMPLSEIP